MKSNLHFRQQVKMFIKHFLVFALFLGFYATSSFAQQPQYLRGDPNGWGATQMIERGGVYFTRWNNRLINRNL